MQWKSPDGVVTCFFSITIVRK